jgi:hypothetical protein
LRDIGEEERSDERDSNLPPAEERKGGDDGLLARRRAERPPRSRAHCLSASLPWAAKRIRHNASVLRAAFREPPVDEAEHAGAKKGTADGRKRATIFNAFLIGSTESTATRTPLPKHITAAMSRCGNLMK